jgi:hypothetical protein
MTKLAKYLDPAFFRGSLTPDDILAALYKARDSKKPNYIALGEMFGEAVGTETLQQSDDPRYAGKDPTLNIVGQFQGICYETGEIREAAGAILPNYFRKLVAGQIERNKDGALFHIEIGVELTGRTIPWAWCVVNKMETNPDSKFGRMAAGIKLERPKQLTAK